MLDMVKKHLKIKLMVHQHALWLKTQGQEGKRFDMKGRNLSDIDLSGADLRGAKLQNAK
jgi:uncharacterized protein YjbI with pentapeptide repeats